MLQKIEKIGSILQGYGKRVFHPNIFESISPAFYRENFHSDILCYYLGLELPKRKFIEFLNEADGGTRSRIEYNEYHNGDVVREENRIDLTLFSKDRKKAIFIENKSNDAHDMDKQVLRYTEILEHQSIHVERIVYLRKKNLGRPNMSAWIGDDAKRIMDKLIAMQFKGQNGFCDNILGRVIQETRDERLKGISMEIQALFESLLSGGIDLELTKQLVAEIRQNENLTTVRNIVKAYGDLPQYWVDKFYTYLKNKLSEYQWHVGLWRNDCVYVDGIMIDNVNYGFDLFFTSETIQIVPITRTNDRKEKLEILQRKMRENWPFNSDSVDMPEKYEILSQTGEQTAFETLKKIIKAMRNAQAG